MEVGVEKKKIKNIWKIIAAVGQKQCVPKFMDVFELMLS